MMLETDIGTHQCHTGYAIGVNLAGCSPKLLYLFREYPQVIWQQHPILFDVAHSNCKLSENIPSGENHHAMNGKIHYFYGHFQ